MTPLEWALAEPQQLLDEIDRLEERLTEARQEIGRLENNVISADKSAEAARQKLAVATQCLDELLVGVEHSDDTKLRVTRALQEISRI